MVATEGSPVFDTDGHKITVSTALTGDGNITKQGEGTLLISGSGSVYAGNIAVKAGALAVDATGKNILTSAATVGEVTLGTQLLNSSVENAGSGLLTVSHAANIITDVYATAGNLTIMQQAAELNPDDLVVKAEKTVSVYTGTTVNTAAEANITVNKYTEFGAEATLSLPALAALAARRRRAAQAK